MLFHNTLITLLKYKSVYKMLVFHWILLKSVSSVINVIVFDIVIIVVHLIRCWVPIKAPVFEYTNYCLTL